MNRTYSELISLPTFEQRFNYCMLNGLVGGTTFGSFRYLNQALYHGDRWKRLKSHLIDRDKACELAFDDYKIRGPIYLHHLNPVTAEQAEELDDQIFDPENLVCVSFRMHNAIHYGSYDSVKPPEEIERRPFDTCPWRLT